MHSKLIYMTLDQENIPQKISIILPENPTLKDYQNYLAAIVKERGFDHETITETFMLFTEECGELAKALRQYEQIKSGEHSIKHNLAYECADVLIYLIEICNLCGVDLEKAFLDKEEINSKREWK